MNANTSPSVSVVIPSWNGRMLLEEMFPALLAATNEFHLKTGGPWEVIVVDDGSVDDTISWIEAMAHTSGTWTATSTWTSLTASYR